MRVLISGATGLLGRALARSLASDGHQVWGLSRQPPHSVEGPFQRWFTWDTLVGILPPGALEGVEAVVHLAGEPVAEGRWSAERKRKILETRTLGTRAIVQAVGLSPVRPKVLVAASAVGYYGDRGDEVLTEESGPGKTFLAQVCQAWERESTAAAKHGLRVVQHRIGIVLSPEGGALAKMLPAFRMGVGGKLGSGKQYLPWIHLQDLVGLMRFSLANEAVRGPLNTAAPGVVTNAVFAHTLGHVLHRPSVAAVPAFALRMALGEMASATLESQRVSAEKARSLGYVFRFPDLEPALRDLLGHPAHVAAEAH